MRSLLDRRSAIGSVCGRRTKALSGACAAVVVGLELGLRTRLSLSLSLCAWVRKWFEVKIFTSNHFRVKSIKTHSQLKIIFEKFIFHAQPNTCIYRKTFPKVIWNQNKHCLKLKGLYKTFRFLWYLLQTFVFVNFSVWDRRFLLVRVFFFFFFPVPHFLNHQFLHYLPSTSPICLFWLETNFIASLHLLI